MGMLMMFFVVDVDELPVMILSHGIGANRFIYTHFASQLAEHGVCVLAVEHTDGLGSAAKPAGARCARTPTHA